MAVTGQKTQVLWDTDQNSKSITAAGNGTSEPVDVPLQVTAQKLMIKADNAGTPADGDVLTIKLLCTTGDPDAEADVTDEYTTAGHTEIAVELDTFVEDPAITLVDVPYPIDKFKVYAANGASANAIVVSAQLFDSRAS